MKKSKSENVTTSEVLQDSLGINFKAILNSGPEALIKKLKNNKINLW